MKRFAYVGYWGNPGDEEMLLNVLDSLPKNYSKNPQIDIIDLRTNDRDFLLEDKEYDVIILFYLFRGKAYVPEDKGTYFEVSKINSWGNWFNKFKNCGAEYIFLFGGCAEISGSFIGNLPNYEKQEIGNMTKYIRTYYENRAL
jgi:hypothetical protein